MSTFIRNNQRALGPQAERVIAELNAKKRQFEQAVQENIEMQDLGLKRKEDELKPSRLSLKKGKQHLSN